MGKSRKSIWWMPGLTKTMKDVAACDKLRWGGKQPLTRGFPNGETYPVEDRMSGGWIHRPLRRQPDELKHLSSRRKREKKWLLTIGDDLSSLMVSNLDSLSSGERKGTSLNLLNYDYEQFTVSNLKALKPYVFQVLQDDCVAV